MRNGRKSSRKKKPEERRAATRAGRKTPTKSAPPARARAREDRQPDLNQAAEQAEAMATGAGGDVDGGPRQVPLGRRPAPALTRTGRWRRPFLEVLAATANVTRACAAVAIDRRTAYETRDRDKAFAQQWREALDHAADLLEGELRRRAYEGVLEPVFGSLGAGAGSGQVGVIRRYSDQVGMFLLRAARPETYRERHQVTVANEPRTPDEAAAEADGVIAELARALGPAQTPSVKPGEAGAGDDARVADRVGGGARQPETA